MSSPLQKRLLNKFGSVKGIFEAPEEELQTVPFIKDKFVVLLKLIREINTIYRKQKLMELLSSIL